VQPPSEILRFTLAINNWLRRTVYYSFWNSRVYWKIFLDKVMFSVSAVSGQTC